MPEEHIKQPITLLPTVLVIFGANGNLSRNKLLPALYELLRKGRLPEKFTVVCILHSQQNSIDGIFEQVTENIRRIHTDVDQRVLDRLKSIVMPLVMDGANEQDYQVLSQTLDDLDTAYDVPCQRLFYLAIPPSLFPSIIQNLTTHRLNDESSGTARRILVEKPFGVDLPSAKELVRVMATSFRETQIYRIDHYLAKQNVQNILAFRFGNPLIEDIWGRQFIDCIQISALEQVGVDARGNFYEHMGALRDFIQSHLMQLMALIMMETPNTLDSDSIHRGKFALLQAVEVIKPSQIQEVAVRGQYDGYRDEVGNPASTTETYVALKLAVANSRWADVPVLLRTGKSLAKQVTEINVIFKDRSLKNLPANCLKIRIQPNEGISIKLVAQAPGFEDNLQNVSMDFTYNASFKAASPDAYERVLIDCITGDQSLFASHEEVMRCWEILQPLIQYWEGSTEQPLPYQVAAAGPAAADELASSVAVEWL